MYCPYPNLCRAMCAVRVWEAVEWRSSHPHPGQTRQEEIEEDFSQIFPHEKISRFFLEERDFPSKDSSHMRFCFRKKPCICVFFFKVNITIKSPSISHCEIFFQRNSPCENILNKYTISEISFKVECIPPLNESSYKRFFPFRVFFKLI